MEYRYLWRPRTIEHTPSFIVTFALILTAVIALLNNVLHLTPAKVREHVVTTGVALAGLGGLIWLLTEHTHLLSASPRTMIVMMLTLAAGAIVIGVLRYKPTLAGFLHDSRIAAMNAREFVVHTALRIPAVSALAEEVLFRGVVWALLASIGGTWFALVGSSVAFGLWHVVVSGHQARRMETPMARWIAGSVAATFAAGVAFGLLRLITGGVWAPAAAHATINIVGSIGARVAARSTMRGGLATAS
jgi:membrane protease YdiL (CAAX protease family)